MTNEQDTQWTGHATQWKWIGSPLRPTQEDVRLLEKPLWDSLAHRPRSRILMTGLTPEIQCISRPADSTLFAADSSWAMISVLGQKDRGALAEVTCCHWLSMPFLPSSFDLVIGDGCHNLLPCPGQYHRLHRELRALLRPGGRMLFRFFIRKNSRETIDDVLNDLNAGRIGNFHVFKWRLLQALHDDNEGVLLGQVWDVWDKLGLTPSQLSKRHGWPEEEVLTIDSYHGKDIRYWLPNKSELEELLAADSRVLSITQGHYELAELCPVVLFEPR